MIRQEDLSLGLRLVEPPPKEEPICSVCKEPSNNSGKGLFYCQTCKDFRCDRAKCFALHQRGVLLRVKGVGCVPLVE